MLTYDLAWKFRGTALVGTGSLLKSNFGVCELMFKKEQCNIETVDAALESFTLTVSHHTGNENGNHYITNTVYMLFI